MTSSTASDSIRARPNSNRRRPLQEPLMSVSKPLVLDELRRIKGPDLQGNIVDLGLVSEILVKDERVYFSITVPADRAEELEPLRQAAEKVVRNMPGVRGHRRADGGGGARRTCRRTGTSAESPRVAQAGRRARRATARTAMRRPRSRHIATPPPAAAQPGTGPKPMARCPASKPDRGGVGQGRRRQIDDRRQSRARPAGRRHEGRHPRCRHLRPLQPRLLGLTGRPE